MEFNQLTDDSDTYLFGPFSPSSSIVPPGVEDQAHLNKLQTDRACFNAYAGPFNQWFEPGKRYDTKVFQNFLHLYMFFTNTFLRRNKRGDTIRFLCYCSRENRKNKLFCQSPCKFSIVVASCERNQILILTALLVHDHVMLPKELYCSLIFKAGMKHFGKYIRKEIEKYLESPAGKDCLKGNKKKWLYRNEEEVAAKYINLYVEELRPGTIWNSIVKSSCGSEIDVLLKQLGIHKNDLGAERGGIEIKKKFSNLVAKIKKEMAINCT